MATHFFKKNWSYNYYSFKNKTMIRYICNIKLTTNNFTTFTDDDCLNIYRNLAFIEIIYNKDRHMNDEPIVRTKPSNKIFAKRKM